MATENIGRVKGGSGKRWKLLTAVAIILAFVFESNEVGAWDGNRRGFVLGFGAGFGATGFTQEIDDPYYRTFESAKETKSGLSTDFKIGGAPTNQVLILYTAKVNWFSMVNASNNKVTVTSGTGNLALMYFLLPQSPSWFLAGGFGWSTWDLPFEDMKAWTGSGGFLGGGYEFSKHWNLEGDLFLGNPNTTEAGTKYTTNFMAYKLTINILGY